MQQQHWAFNGTGLVVGGSFGATAINGQNGEACETDTSDLWRAATFGLESNCSPVPLPYVEFGTEYDQYCAGITYQARGPQVLAQATSPIDPGNGTGGNGQSHVASEIVYYQPTCLNGPSGYVFSAGSITFPQATWTDATVRQMMTNVINHPARDWCVR
jgi:hypothetical protein